MKRIAVLGLGAMGSRMATRLIGAGFDLAVWNRTPDKAGALVERGARLADSPANAADGADVVLAMLRDDDASQAAWFGARGAADALAPDAIAIDSSTLGLAQVEAMATQFERRSRRFIDAPVLGSRPQAEAGQLIVLAGGEESAASAAAPVFDAVSSAVHYCGASGTGATLKLMANSLFAAQLAVLAELIGLVDRAALSAETAIDIIGQTPVCSPAAKAAADAMIARSFAPAFPIELVIKDLDLADSTASRLGADMPIVRTIRDRYRAASDAGYGGDNITGIARLYRD